MFWARNTPSAVDTRHLRLSQPRAGPTQSSTPVWGQRRHLKYSPRRHTGQEGNTCMYRRQQRLPETTGRRRLKIRGRQRQLSDCRVEGSPTPPRKAQASTAPTRRGAMAAVSTGEVVQGAATTLGDRHLSAQGTPRPPSTTQPTSKPEAPMDASMRNSTMKSSSNRNIFAVRKRRVPAKG